jgi:hypothetical protein
MDADVLITIAFCLEVVLLALAAGILVLHELRKARAGTAAAWRGGPDWAITVMNAWNRIAITTRMAPARQLRRFASRPIWGGGRRRWIER